MRTLEAKILDPTYLELVEPIKLRPGREEFQPDVVNIDLPQSHWPGTSADGRMRFQAELQGVHESHERLCAVSKARPATVSAPRGAQRTVHESQEPRVPPPA